jgi:hypothetical protein
MMKDSVHVWKRHMVSNLGFLHIIVKAARNVIRVVAIGNSNHLWEEEREGRKTKKK